MLPKRSMQSVSLSFFGLRVPGREQSRSWSQVSQKSKLGSREPGICLGRLFWGTFPAVEGSEVGMAVFPLWASCGRCPAVPADLALAASRSVTGRSERTDEYLWVNKYFSWKNQR